MIYHKTKCGSFNFFFNTQKNLLDFIFILHCSGYAERNTYTSYRKEFELRTKKKCKKLERNNQDKKDTELKVKTGNPMQM
jgi:hypothetical protein